MQRVALVSCVGSKAASAAPAADLYRSAWFRKARVFAEAGHDRWWILSALHGVLSPDEIIAPYEKTLNRMRAAARRAWADRVLAQLDQFLPPGTTVVFLAGQRYREHLEPALVRRGHQVEVPMRGLGIGHQLQWLTRRAAP